MNRNEIKVIDTILKNLHYFGRSESWCTASTSTAAHSYNCSPLIDHDLPADADPVQVLVPRPDAKFVDTRNPGSKPDGALDSVSVTTKELQGRQLCGSPRRNMDAVRQTANCFEEKPEHSTRAPHLDSITLVRYAVVGTVRPLIKDALRVGVLQEPHACQDTAGQTRPGIVHIFRKGCQRQATHQPQACVLSAHIRVAKKGDRSPHSYRSPAALGGMRLSVLLSLDRLYARNSPDIDLVFQGCGRPDSFSKIPILKEARSWISATRWSFPGTQSIGERDQTGMWLTARRIRFAAR